MLCAQYTLQMTVWLTLRRRKRFSIKVIKKSIMFGNLVQIIILLAISNIIIHNKQYQYYLQFDVEYILAISMEGACIEI